MYAKNKWSCGAETVKKFKVQIWPLIFWPRSTEVLLRSRSTYMWSIIIVCKMEEELLYRNPLFTDGQTDGQTDRQTVMVKPVYLHIFVGRGIQTYFECGEIVEKWPPPPGSQNFMGGVTFSRPVVQNLTLQFEPCKLLTLKNDPGSPFYRWKIIRGVIFHRGHYLMLHRLWYLCYVCIYIRNSHPAALRKYCQLETKASWWCHLQSTCF